MLPGSGSIVVRPGVDVTRVILASKSLPEGMLP